MNFNIDFIKNIINKYNLYNYLKEIKKYDEDTFIHCIRVSIISLLLAQKLNFDKNSIEELIITALLHDLGKIQINKKILNKKERLTTEEFNLIKTHSIFGYNLLKNNENISNITKISILFHHENENGSGYPFNLKNNEIPLYSKIVHIADNYDALKSKRVYKDSFTKESCITYLQSNKDIMFDSNILKEFLLLEIE